MSKYAKLFAPIVATVLVAVTGFISDGELSLTEILVVASGAAMAVQTYVIPNVPEFPWSKGTAAVVIVILDALVLAIVDGVQIGEWLNLAVLALGALGIFPATNRGDYLDQARHAGPDVTDARLR